MRRCVSAIALIFIAVSAAQAQYPLEISYDKFKDKTTVQTKGLQVTGTQLRGVQLKLIGLHDGNTMKAPGEIAILFLSAAEEQRFSNDKELIFMLDDTRLKLGDMSLAKRDYSSGTYMEALLLPIPLESIRKISNAIHIEGKVGSVEFKLTAEQKAAIGMFVDYFTVKK